MFVSIKADWILVWFRADIRRSHRCGFLCLQGALSAAASDGSGVQKQQTWTGGADRDAGKITDGGRRGLSLRHSVNLSLLPSNQKLLCEDRFVGGVPLEVEVLEKQLLSQMLEAIRVTPSLHEDLQVEVMKVRLLYHLISFLVYF